MSKALSLLLLFSLSLCHTVLTNDDHFCGEYNVPPIIEKNSNGETSVNEEIPYTPFRIYIDYAHLNTQLNIKDIFYINSIKNLIDKAKGLFEQLMTFKQRKPILALGRNSCFVQDQPGETYQLKTSPHVQSPGVEADLIIIPYLDPYITGSTIAAAGPCFLADYPYLGLIKISTTLKLQEKSLFNYFLAVFMHEMTHIFAFNSSLYKLFKDPNGMPHPNVTIKKVVNGLERTLLATPKVIEAAKKHFGCDSIDGVELENQGGSGTIGHHWEGRVMLSDYMVGITYEEMFISDITLALFEDSGWYKMNNYTGGLFKYGKGEGCSFLNQKCVVNKKSTNPKYFETESYKPMCLPGRTTKGNSYISMSSEVIPKEFQYFDDPLLGGFRIADYCPVGRSYNEYEQNCKTGVLELEAYGEVLSDTSNCFLSSLSLNTTTEMVRAICYPFKCNFSQKTTLITVSGKGIDCPTEGGDLSFEGFNGTIQCPKFIEICTTKTPCFGITDCVEKKSLLAQSLYIRFNAVQISLIIAFFIL